LIRRGFNDTYLLESSLIDSISKKYIFRVYLNHKYYIETPEEFQFELDLLEHLHKESIPVANALRMNDGGLLGTIPTALGERAFALFSYAEGEELSKDTMTIERCFLFGKTMADLHLAANSFQSTHKRYHLNLKYLVDEPLRLIAKKTNKDSVHFIGEEGSEEIKNSLESLESIDHLVEAVRSLPCDQDEFGVIHADLHLGNIHFQDNKLMLFDFDHCAYGWRAYDLAVSLFFPSDQRSSIIKGYESRRPLSKAERECLPVFADLRQLWDIGDTLHTELIRVTPS
jgi:Ser/Thr protein kinase RdoA (MazF antagonist)